MTANEALAILDAGCRDSFGDLTFKQGEALSVLGKCVEKAEAELEKARPLLGAAECMSHAHIQGWLSTEERGDDTLAQDFLRAALAYRKSKENDNDTRGL